MEGKGKGWRKAKNHENKIEITSFPLKVSQIILHVLEKKRELNPIHFLNSLKATFL